MKKSTIIMVGLLGVIIILLAVIFWMIFNNSNKKTSGESGLNKISKTEQKIDNNTNDGKDENKNNKISCPNGWQEYRQNVIGIEFCYPEKEWGKVNTEYLKNITNLKNLKNAYKEQNVYYPDFVKITFDNNNSNKKVPTIKIFNDEYLGEHYKNAQTHKLGYRDNIQTLKQTGDICQYKINFTKKWANKGSESEFYNNCKNDIKTALVEQKDYFDWKDQSTGKIIGWKWQYFLSLFAYKQLKNGYYNNALIKYNVDNTSQLKNKLQTFQDFFSLDHSYKDDKRITLTQAEFNQDKIDFEKFIKSIKTFKPVKENLAVYKATGIDENTNLIANYYWLLTNKKFTEAYALKNTNQSLAEFTGQYKNIHYAQPYDFIKKGNNGYEFYIKYQDNNDLEEKYQVKVKIVDNRIKTELTQKFLTEKVKYEDNLVAYAVTRGDKNYVILEKDGQETIVDQGSAKYDKDYKNLNNVKGFKNIKFSPKGNYLIYGIMGYEWYISMVYDIQQKKNVKELSSGEKVGFTDDEKYIYLCGINEMSGGESGLVQRVVDFKNVFDVFQGDFKRYSKSEKYNIINCSYDKIKNIIRFTLSDYNKNYSDKIAEYKIIK